MGFNNILILLRIIIEVWRIQSDIREDIKKI